MFSKFAQRRLVGLGTAACAFKGQQNLLPTASTQPHVQYRFGWARPRNQHFVSDPIIMSRDLDSESAAKDMNVLAKNAHQAQNYDDALMMYERVLVWRRKQEAGPTSEPVANTLHNMARVCIDKKLFPKAENYLTESCAIIEAKYGNKHVKYADSLGLLGLCYRELRFGPQAEKAFKDALLIFKDEYYNHAESTWIPSTRETLDDPSQHPLASVAHILSDCATLFLSIFKEELALNLLEDALQIRRYLYKKNIKFKPIIAQTLMKVAEIRRNLRGDHQGALLLMEEAVAICLATLGRENAATAAAISGKGNCLTMDRRLLEALKCYEEAATTYALTYGKDSHLVGMELLHVGKTLQMLGGKHFASAEKKFIKAAEICRASLGQDHVQVADCSMHLADWLLANNEIPRCIVAYRESIKIRGGLKNDVMMPHLEQKLGDALCINNDPEAEAHLLNAIELHRSFIKAQPAQEKTRQLMCSDCLDSLGEFYNKNKLHDKAEEAFVESLDIRLKWLHSGHSTVAFSHSSLAVLAFSQDQYHKAIGFCLQALEAYEVALSGPSGEGSGGTTQLAQADCHHLHGKALFKLNDLPASKICYEKALQLRRKEGEPALLCVVESLYALSLWAYEMGLEFEDVGLQYVREGGALLEQMSSTDERVKYMRANLIEAEKSFVSRSNQQETVHHQHAKMSQVK